MCRAAINAWAPQHTLICVQDDDPYVRKTAAICVAKLWDINPDMVDDRGFVDMLRVRQLCMPVECAILSLCLCLLNKARRPASQLQLLNFNNNVFRY